MKRAVLVLTEHPEAVAGLLMAADRLAECVGGGDIEVVAVRRPVWIPILAMTDGKFSKPEVDRFVSDEQRRLSALNATYARWASRITGGDVAANWLIVNGETEAVVKTHGTRADFIVTARPATDDDAATREMFRTAIFGTNRPVLVVPNAPHVAFGRRVAIAWRDDAFARKSIMAALPLIAGAEQLHVFAGVREGRPPAALPDFLQDQAPRVSLHVIPLGGRPLGETLLSRSQTLGIDLLVMGAYFHSPLREQIFGGVTRSMLAQAGIPLFMFH